jgi:hypothetical protein
MAKRTPKVTGPVIAIYRKGSNGKRRPMTKANRANLDRTIALRARVQRPGIVEFFAGGDFYRLPETPARVIDSPADRVLHHKANRFVVPVTEFGRVQEAVASGDPKAMRSACQSLLLWVKQNLAECVDASDLSIVIDPE